MYTSTANVGGTKYRHLLLQTTLLVIGGNIMQSKFQIGDYVTYSHDIFVEEIIAKVYSNYLETWLYIISNNCSVFKENELRLLEITH